MTSRRIQKAAEAIREVVSMAILADLKDPRIAGVTVTFVEVAGDMRQAKVHVSVMGDEAQQNLSLHGLQSAAGYLQKKVSQRIDTRYTPKLQFVLDLGVKKSIEIARILQTVLPDATLEGSVVGHAEFKDEELEDAEVDDAGDETPDELVAERESGEAADTDDDPATAVHRPPPS